MQAEHHVKGNKRFSDSGECLIFFTFFKINTTYTEQKILDNFRYFFRMLTERILKAQEQKRPAKPETRKSKKKNKKSYTTNILKVEMQKFVSKSLKSKFKFRKKAVIN